MECFHRQHMFCELLDTVHQTPSTKYSSTIAAEQSWHQQVTYTAGMRLLNFSVLRTARSALPRSTAWSSLPCSMLQTQHPDTYSCLISIHRRLDMCEEQSVDITKANDLLSKQQTGFPSGLDLRYSNANLCKDRPALREAKPFPGIESAVVQLLVIYMKAVVQTQRLRVVPAPLLVLHLAVPVHGTVTQQLRF